MFLGSQESKIGARKDKRASLMFVIHISTRSTQRAQTSLAKADHYSHIAHCKNVEPWLWKTISPPPLKKKKKKKKNVLDHYLHHDLGMLPLLWWFFAHLLILQYPDHQQNLISSSLYYSGPLHKISSQSVHNFLSNVVHRQTDKLTNQRYQKHNLLCQGGNNPFTFLHVESCSWVVFNVLRRMQDTCMGRS